jgi:hypothetical protein
MRAAALSARAVLRIVLRPVNESEPPAVPPSEHVAPMGDGNAAKHPFADAAPAGADAGGGDTDGGDGGAPEGGGPDGHGADGGGADGGSAADGAGAPGDGGERRRRRRRRRRGRGQGGAEGGAPDATQPDSPEGAPGDVTAPAGDAAAAAAAGQASGQPSHPHAQRGPHAPRHGGRQGQQGNQGQRGQHDRHERGRHDHERDRQRRRGDSQHAAMQAVMALADMAHALLRVEGVDPLAMPRYLELNLRVPLDGGNDIRHAAGTAVEQISKRVREVREHEQALRPGAVYCYFHGTSHAEGCRPTEPRHVFDGYSSTGKPIFTDFVTMAIERKDPQIERLLAGEEIVLTRVTMGRVLRTQQLAEFGSHSPVFKILGQVDAGLFRVLGAAGRCAFSFQLLRGTTLEGRVRLRLHAVGAVDPMDLADPALMQILSRFQRHLDVEAMRLQGQLQNGEVDEEAFVLPMLQEFAQRLQSRTRNTGRRTQHGLERSEEGQRPTSRAYPDAGEAHDADILWDLDQNTVVVLGGKGRVHVFTPQGKHVTSVTMQGQAIERRRHMGRWRLAEPEERGEFRIHIKRLIASGQDSTQEDAVAPQPGANPPAAGSGPATQA